MTETPISFPIRATYGEVNRGHGLRRCSGPAELLPSGLLDLTDKPPGHIPAGEIWGPAVGCAPIGDWWALWWTESDRKASRAGMAISEVALWPLDDTAFIVDLSSELRKLNGGFELPRPNVDVVAAMADMLINPNPNIPVFGDLELWPGLLAALWLRLWPEARKTFSARVAISPPQHGMSISPPLIYGVAKGRIAEWQNHPIVRPDNVIAEGLSRGVRWLVGETDHTISALVDGRRNLGPALAVLRRIGRAADRLDAVHLQPDSSNAVELLRTLQSLEDEGISYKEYQQEAARALLENFKDASFLVVLSLANIRTKDLLDGGNFQEHIDSWVESKLFDISFSTAEMLLARLEPGKAEDWWSRGIQSGIAKGVRGRDPRWMKFLLNWLCEKTPEGLLHSIVDNSIEESILAVAPHTNLSQFSAKNLAFNAEAFGWSRLYAIAIMSLESPIEAVRLQLQFKTNMIAGLVVLVERLQAKDVIAAALDIEDDRLISLTTSLTVRDPTLLSDLDLASPKWRRLWEAHVLAGGDPWPVPIDINTQAKNYLAFAKRNESSVGIVSGLAKYFGPIALSLPHRARLWDRLHPSDATVLGQTVAELLLNQCDSLSQVDKPENFVFLAVISGARNISLSAAQASYLLAWDHNASESTALAKMYDIRRWSVGAERFGRLVHERRWKTVANKLASYYRMGHTEVLPAVHACYDFLGIFDSWLIPNPFGAIAPSLDSNALVSEVAEIGSEIAHDRLEDIWLRAGGKAAQLVSYGTFAERWRKACAQAHAGMLSGGVLALVRELRTEFANNERLKVLEEILRNKL